MTTLPIPLVVAFLLVIIAASNRQSFNETPTGRVFALVLYLNAFGMLLVGIRWTWDVLAVLPVVAMLSVISVSLLYLAFLSLGRTGTVISFSRDWRHMAPACLVLFSALVEPQWIELWLISTKALYIILLIRLAYQYPLSLQLVHLSWLNNTKQALWAVVLLQLISMMVDIAITADFALYGGRHAANLVGFVSLMSLMLLGYAAVLASRGKVAPEPHENVSEPEAPVVTTSAHDSSTTLTNPESTAAANHSFSTDLSPAPVSHSRPLLEPDPEQLMTRLNKLLIDGGLYADTELNLQKLARKAGIPARTISRTVNARTGQNISQWVNRARIDAVCQLLRNPEKSVTEAMGEAGFVTKSNFNREFRRVKGSSPSEWREKSSQLPEK